MSKRGDRIYSELLSMTAGLSQQELLEIQGILTTDLADSLDIQRSNVSMELNKMVRDGKVGKIKTFPVRYIPVEVIEKNFDFQWNTPPYEIKSLNELLLMDGTEMLFEKNPFQSLIGAEGSLKQPIAQAKTHPMDFPHYFQGTTETVREHLLEPCINAIVRPMEKRVHFFNLLAMNTQQGRSKRSCSLVQGMKRDCYKKPIQVFYIFQKYTF